MLLIRLLRNIWNGRAQGLSEVGSSVHPKVLCVGGSEQFQMMPSHYIGWRRELLSSEPNPEASIVQSLYKLDLLPGAAYDAVFFAHRLKNHPLHDAGRILHGFRHLIRPGGFVHIVVPDVMALMRHMLENDRDLEDAAYMSPAGSVSYHDVLFGRVNPTAGSATRLHEPHLCGYSPKVLKRVLFDNGFLDCHVVESPEHFEVHAIAAPEPIHERFHLIMGLKKA